MTDDIDPADPEVNDDERHRTALHESAHAFVAYILGWSLGALSIVPGRTAGGVCPVARVSEPRPLDEYRLAAAKPVEVRRYYESEALIRAAGDVAENLLWWPSRGTAVRTLELAHLAAAEAAPVSETERLRLIAAVNDDGLISDEKRLAQIARAIYPNDDFGVRTTWLRWVGDEATAIVSDGKEQIEQLAAVALERGQLTGEALHAILAAP